MSGSLRSIEQITENSIRFINEQINGIDWNKKWQTDYPKTEVAKAEFESLKQPEVKEAVREVFNENSLAVLKLSEVF